MTIIVKRPPKHGEGPFSTKAEAQRAAMDANDSHGGPGFYVQDRYGYVDTTPHAYVAEEADPGHWYPTLKAMPGL